ncbi:MAG: GC-type dockerin domain-anchored protein [Planctomycetota bacterium]
MPTRPAALPGRTACLASLTALSTALSTAAQIHVFVDDDAPDGGDGLSWATALNDLREAVALSENLGPDRGEIRIAGGTYLGDGLGSLELTAYGDEPELQLVGGFVGLADPSQPDKRDPEDNASLIQNGGSQTAFIIEGVLGEASDARVLSTIGFGVNSGFAGVLRFDGLKFNFGQAISVEAVPEFALAVIDCKFNVSSSPINGGAIEIRDSSLLVRGSEFSGCFAAVNGGAIFHAGRELVIQNSNFAGNTAQYGGAVSTVTDVWSIVGTSFGLNEAIGIGIGGAFYAVNPFGRGTIIASTFTGGRARFGAALFVDCDVSISDSQFQQNIAVESGGAVSSIGRLDVADSTFRENRAETGGAVRHQNAASQTAWDRCTFELNLAAFGGALSLETPSTIRESTFQDNSGSAVRLGIESDVIDSTFIRNVATNDGGAINGPARVNGGFYQGNTAVRFGGAVYGALKIRNAAFTGNIARIYGGAVGDTRVIEDTLFTGNTAASGGSAAFDIDRGSRLEVVGNRLDRTLGPIAVEEGGALFGFDLLEDSTISDNTSDGLTPNLLVGEGAVVRRCRMSAARVTAGPGEQESDGVAVAMDVGATAAIEDSLVQGGLLVDTLSAVRLVGSTIISNGEAVPGLVLGWFALADVESTTVSGPGGVNAGPGSALIFVSSLVEGGLGNVEVAPSALVDTIGNLLTFDPGFVDADGPDDDPLTFEDNDLRPRPASPLIDAGFGFGIASDREFDINGDPRVFQDMGVPDTAPGTEPIDIGAFEFQGFTCLTDVNNDGMVTSADFFAWVNAFGSGDPRADQNRDGSIDSADFFAWVNNFNVGC